MMGPLAVLAWRFAAGVEPGTLWIIITDVWYGRSNTAILPAWEMMRNSFIVALGIATIKCSASILAAYALVMFRLPAREWIFGIILLSMFFPIETRILPTFAVVNELGLLNSYSGMILPVAASGLGVLVFRLFLQQMPGELLEAARLDGAGPLRFFIDIVLPLSMPMLAALFAILFVLGWNQYVWPIMISTTSQGHDTLLRGMAGLAIESRPGMALVFMALVPPTLVFLALQRFLVRGLTAGIH
ncbi:MAG: ABC transporter permease subunit [Pseudomonadota bacterium]